MITYVQNINNFRYSQLNYQTNIFYEFKDEDSKILSIFITKFILTIFIIQ